MPFGSRVLLTAVPIVLALILACGGDDDEQATATPSPSRSPTATRDRETETPNGGDDKPTPDEETPNGGSEPTEDGGPAPTPAPEGTPAVAPPDQAAYVGQFQGRDVTEEECIYDPTTLVVTCPDRGRFAIDPPLQGQDIICALGLVDGTPEYIRCRSQQPLQAIYYEIQ
jgi:hypothetical protein